MARSLEDRVKSLEAVAVQFRYTLSLALKKTDPSDQWRLGFLTYMHDEIDRVIKDEPKIVNGIKRYG